MVRLARSRLSALQFFRSALLVNIFLMQFFVFYQEQLAALPGLLLNIGFLKSVDYARAQEARRVTAGRGSLPRGAQGVVRVRSRLLRSTKSGS